jgi:hypothetical protein
MIHHFQKLTGKKSLLYVSIQFKIKQRHTKRLASNARDPNPPRNAPAPHTAHLSVPIPSPPKQGPKAANKAPPLPGEPPELRLEEALGLLRRERVPHHELPRGRLVPLDSRSRVPLSLHTHGPTRHHGDGPRPRGVEPTRHGRNAREDSVWGKADGGEIGNAGSVAGALSLGREAETGCVRGQGGEWRGEWVGAPAYL